MLLTEVTNFRLAIHLFKVEVMGWDGDRSAVGTNILGKWKWRKWKAESGNGKLKVETES